MPVLISLLRGINVGGRAVIRMEALQTLYQSLKFEAPQTYLQSGNVLFKSSERDLQRIASQIQKAIVKKFACSPEVILRSTAEMRVIVSRNPFRSRPDIEPNKLLVSFLADPPGKDARENLAQLHIEPEELHLFNRELYIYFPNGVGRSKLPWSRLDKFLKTPSTARNWNSVIKILEIAEKMEAAS
jgi:uncharacterized protein (DUF1697 family)